MSQIRTVIFAGATLTALALGGCGNENSKAVFHSESGKHPAGWVTGHRNSTKIELESCIECHGEDLKGGISLVGCMSPTAISGFRCHATNPIENPTGCVSCHGGTPGGPFGGASDPAPNRKFAHAKHTALTGCGSCHVNAGSGSPDHAKADPATGGIRRATVAIADSLRAKTLTSFGYDLSTGKCSGINCHGGKETPAWSSGTIVIATDCMTCHEMGTAMATPQYNSFFSGIKSGINLHSLHLNTAILSIFCTDCHNVGALADYKKHFGGISNNSFVSPRDTVGGAPTKIGSYTGTTQTCSSIACHPDSKWTQP